MIVLKTRTDENLGSLQIFRLNLAETNRMEIHDTSYNLAKAMVHFLYVGKVDPAFAQHRGIDLFVTAHRVINSLIRADIYVPIVSTGPELLFWWLSVNVTNRIPHPCVQYGVESLKGVLEASIVPTQGMLYVSQRK